MSSAKWRSFDLGLNVLSTKLSDFLLAVEYKKWLIFSVYVLVFRKDDAITNNR